MQVVIFACSILSLGAVLGTLPNSREGNYIPYTSRVLTDVPRSGHQVVIFACSILSLGTVLGALPVQRLRRSTLFVDVLSVKEFPKRLMLSLLPPEVRPETLTKTLHPCGCAVCKGVPQAPHDVAAAAGGAPGNPERNPDTLHMA